jgi:cytochrome c peroxidase
VASLFLLLVPALESYGQNGGRNRGRDRDRDFDALPLPLPQPPVLAALPRTAAAPADNPTTPAKVALGRLLFWDPILSGNRDVACASCHHPRFGYAENIDVSIGVNGVGLGANRRFASSNTNIPFVKRNSPTVLNTAFNGIDQAGNYDPATAPMFWDMRAKGLEAQALEPIKSFEEMRGDAYPEDQAVATVVARLNTIPEYRTLFSQAFGAPNAVTAVNLAKAMSSFQRSLLANNSPFDRYMRGDRTAMTAAQIEGMRRFEAVGCNQCHNGPMFSDYKPHVLGVDDTAKRTESDAGIPDSPYAFRTASLRNLRLTAPYMHSGQLPDLEEVVEFYDDLPENPNVQRQQVDRLARRLDDPDDEEDAIIAFLGALNDDSFDKTIPARVPSGLPVGGKIQ